MRWLGAWVAFGVVMTGGEAWAAWERTFSSAADTGIHAFMTDPAREGRMLIGVQGGVLESRDSGRTWKRVLTVSSVEAVRYLAREEGGGEWWAATPHALYRSVNGGLKWEPASFFLRNEGDGIRCLSVSGPRVFAGRTLGLSVSEDRGGVWSEPREFAGKEIFQIEIDLNGEVWIAAADGLYEAARDGGWRRIYGRVPTGPEEDGADNVAGELESLDLADPDDGLRFWFGPDRTVTIMDGAKVYRYDRSTESLRSAGMLPEAILSLPRSGSGDPRFMAFGTRRGVGLREEDGEAYRALEAGWPGGEARTLLYEPGEDRLYAVSTRGVFHFDHPELVGFLENRGHADRSRADLLLEHFADEPGILELQQAAMQYAEVHPEKIIVWRRQAASRAWLPSLTFGHDRGQDQTVDIDRGGTADLDRFIQGPDEEDRQWSVDVSWDLADLIWSTDQTTIDNRSKLMVQLREDLLSQLNHLYYARRRLQVAGLMDGGGNLERDLERRLQIEEYAAGLDALTGGYFSRRMREIGPVLKETVLER